MWARGVPRGAPDGVRVSGQGVGLRVTKWRPGDAYWVAVHRDDDATRIEAGGELDLGTREALQQAVIDALSEPSADELVIDLREVTFIDASAVHAAVVDSAVVAQSTGVRCHVLASERVRRILEIAGLDDLID